MIPAFGWGQMGGRKEEGLTVSQISNLIAVFSSRLTVWVRNAAADELFSWQEEDSLPPINQNVPLYDHQFQREQGRENIPIVDSLFISLSLKVKCRDIPEIREFITDLSHQPKTQIRRHTNRKTSELFPTADSPDYQYLGLGLGLVTIDKGISYLVEPVWMLLSLTSYLMYPC